MKKNLIALFFSILFITLASCSDSGVGAGKDFPITLPTPAGWTQETNYKIAANTTVDIAIFAPFREQSFRANVLVMSGYLNRSSLEDIADQEIKALRSSTSFSEIEVDTSESRSIQGYNGYVNQFSYTLNGSDILARELIIEIDGFVYLIVFTRHWYDTVAADAFQQIEHNMVIQ